MRKILLPGVLSFFLLFSGVAQAVILSFDEIQGSYYEGDPSQSGGSIFHSYEMPATYAGLKWSGFTPWDTNAMLLWDGQFYASSGGLVSGGTGTVLSVVEGQHGAISGGLFNFEGAQFARGAGEGPHFLTIEGYLGGVLKHSTAYWYPSKAGTFWLTENGEILLTSTTGEWLQCDFQGIDRLTIYGSGIVMENFTYNLVPEPHPVSLLICGIAFFFWKRSTLFLQHS